MRKFYVKIFAISNNNQNKVNIAKSKNNTINFNGSGLRKIYPKIEPFSKFEFPVSRLHTLYIEKSGKPNGEPIVYLHGGPGQGIGEDDRQWFNPNFFNAILFDQRGSGKSKPIGELRENTTNDLIEDMEKIREHLGIKKWSLYGISWGATLALRYAASFPDRISGMVIRGVTPNPQKAVDWLFKENGSGKFLPEMWKKFRNFIPKSERGNLLEAYYKRLSSPDSKINLDAARMYDGWSLAHLRVDSNHSDFPEIDPKVIPSSKIECFYFLNNCFIKPEDLKGLKDIKHAPVEIVQGRWDIISPPANAYEVKELMPDNPNVHINIVEKTGHSTSDPRITSAELTALDNLQKYLSKK